MTENEAKAKLERTSVLWESANNTEIVEAVKMTIKALEKQVPKKVIKTKEHKIGYYECPCCKKKIGTDIVVYQSSYCSYCGQKLEWEGGE